MTVLKVLISFWDDQVFVCLFVLGWGGGGGGGGELYSMRL